MKPRIFIGSSSEGLEVAKKVKKIFEAEYDCHIWNEDIFKENENFLETLLKSASLFDFGFLVFSKDDLTNKRHKQFSTARDNVLFEYGLFLGRLGINRAFVIAEDGVDIPSDLLGITFSYFSTSSDASGNKIVDDKSLNESLEKLKRNIDEKIRLGFLGLLPSTIIAISYFDNFVKLVANWIAKEEPQIIVEDKTYKSAKLHIVIPNNLDADIKEQATAYYKHKALKDINIDTVHRNYPLHATSEAIGDELSIYDMPTILNGLNKAIDLYFHKGFVGKTQEQLQTEIHEMGNFERVLTILIESDTFCREFVKVEHE